MRIPVDSTEARELRDEIDEPTRMPLGVDGRPVWCGSCDKRTRQIEIYGDAVRRCPRCHPLTG